MTLFHIPVSNYYVDVPIENYRPSLYHPYHLQSFPNAPKKITFCIYKHLLFSVHCVCISVSWCHWKTISEFHSSVPWKAYEKKYSYCVCCPIKRKSQKFKSCHSMIICLFYRNVYHCNEIIYILIKDFDIFLFNLETSKLTKKLRNNVYFRQSDLKHEEFDPDESQCMWIECLC